MSKISHENTQILPPRCHKDNVGYTNPSNQKQIKKTRRYASHNNNVGVEILTKEKHKTKIANTTNRFAMRSQHMPYLEKAMTQISEKLICALPQISSPML